MPDISSLRGEAFPIVLSTCANYFFLPIERIASLLLTIPRALTSLSHILLALRHGRLTFRNLRIGGQILENIQSNDNETEIATSKSKNQTNFLPPPPHIYIISIIQPETRLKPATAGTLVYYHYAHHNIYNTLFPTWIQLAILTLPSTSTNLSLCPSCQIRQHGGQTSTNHASVAGPKSTALKRRASSALTGNSRARRTNNSRKNNDNDGGDDDKNWPPNPSDNGDNIPEAEPELGKYLCCPFFKLNPRKYHRCSSKQLKNIDYVKQHIKRKHFSPVQHCNRCWEEFGDDQHALRDHYTRNSGQCDETQGPDTLYDEDLHLLNTGRGISDEDKWYQIWRQMFDGHDPPESPYMDPNGVDEVGGLFGREYQSRVPALLPSWWKDFQVQYHLRPDDTTNIVNRVISDLFSPANTLFISRHRRIFRPMPPVAPAQPHHEPLQETEQLVETPLSPSTALPPPSPEQVNEQTSYQINNEFIDPALPVYQYDDYINWSEHPN